MSPRPPLVLASASPRRRQLLAELGELFEVDPADVDESLEDLDPRQTVETLARRKAACVAARHAEGRILAADTLVVCQGQVLGKPVDGADARRMLHLLSAGWHEVHTGVALQDAGRGEVRSGVSTTRVRWRALSEVEIEAYVDGGEPFGKAGAYAIQGQAGEFVQERQGPHDNVVGLPLALVRRLLAEWSGTPAAPPTPMGEPDE